MLNLESTPDEDLTELLEDDSIFWLLIKNPAFRLPLDSCSFGATVVLESPQAARRRVKEIVTHTFSKFVTTHVNSAVLFQAMTASA